MTPTLADISLLESAASDLDKEARISLDSNTIEGEWQILNEFDKRLKDEHDRYVAQVVGLRALAERMKADGTPIERVA